MAVLLYVYCGCVEMCKVSRKALDGNVYALGSAQDAWPGADATLAPKEPAVRKSSSYACLCH